ncbi:MAG: hypothetical protein AAF761_10830 [Pseudomonadota bacterium]
MENIATTGKNEGGNGIAAGGFAGAEAARLWPQFQPGETVLLAARPHQGKTLLALALAAQAAQAGPGGVFLTGEESAADVAAQLARMGLVQAGVKTLSRDRIGTADVLEQIESAAPGTLVAVDYLQGLTGGPRGAGVAAMRRTARARGVALLCLCQVLPGAEGRMPTAQDLRSADEFGLGQFDRLIALFDGRCEITALTH